MSTIELSMGIALGALWAKLLLDLADFIVEYPAIRRRNKLLKQLMKDISTMSTIAVQDAKSSKKAAKKPTGKKVTVTKSTTTKKASAKR